ncbi:hypothetical protein Leryth_007343 [Lithospermum erythrorhizon]|nr:hypothetical protein Leryth_007343 [Lithospermum erythrorhizon]
MLAILKSASGPSPPSRPKATYPRDPSQGSGDSVYNLRKTLNELQHLRRDSFEWQMSNAETWVSAALTNEDTCLDGFKEIDYWKVKVDVKKKISNIAKVTSNALYLITLLDQSRH